MVITPNGEENMKKMDQLYIAKGMQNGIVSLENSLVVCYKSKHEFTIQTRTHILRCLSQRNN